MVLCSTEPLWCGPKVRITDPTDLVQLNRLAPKERRITKPDLVQLNRAFNKQSNRRVTDTASVIQLVRVGSK